MLGNGMSIQRGSSDMRSWLPNGGERSGSHTTHQLHKRGCRCLGRPTQWSSLFARSSLACFWPSPSDRIYLYPVKTRVLFCGSPYVQLPSRHGVQASSSAPIPGRKSICKSQILAFPPPLAIAACNWYSFRQYLQITRTHRRAGIKDAKHSYIQVKCNKTLLIWTHWHLPEGCKHAGTHCKTYRRGLLCDNSSISFGVIVPNLATCCQWFQCRREMQASTELVPWVEYPVFSLCLGHFQMAQEPWILNIAP